MILLKGFLVIPIISLTKNPSKRIINVTFLSKRTRLKPEEIHDNERVWDRKIVLSFLLDFS